MKTLEVRDLACTRGESTILKGISFQVDSGEVVGILGPNGAGKSTLLRCLNGLWSSEGTVRLLGDDLKTLKPGQVALRSALLHQSSPLPFPFSAETVVMMGRYPHQRRFHPESAADHRIVRTVMAYTDTEALAQRPLDQLSGGERQRVLFAKVLAQDTPLLLLDEPSASLDITHQEQIFQYARTLADGGKAVVVAVHDLRLAARYCHRVLLLNQGTVLAEGTPEDVLTPKNLATAYGIAVKVYRNPITGWLDFHTTQDQPRQGPLVHVICGAGSGVATLHRLAEAGYRVTCGVLAPGDSDHQVAAVLGLSTVTSPPFCPISGAAHAENLRRVGDAEVTILTDLPVGPQNRLNLEAAQKARTLVVLQEGPGSVLPEGLIPTAVLRPEALVGWLASYSFSAR